MRKLLAGVVIVLGATGLAACGDDDDGGTVAPAASDDGGDAGTVEVTAEGGAFTPTAAEVAAGSVHFTVTNEDGGQHTFTMEDADIDLALDGGSTEEADADLDAGEYEWHCKIHPSMTGTLTVT
jgi:plastocyanin